MFYFIPGVAWPVQLCISFQHHGDVNSLETSALQPSYRANLILINSLDTLSFLH